jgi:hypothetical protein
MYANRMSVSSRRPEMKYQIVVSDGVIKVPMKITVEDSVYIPVSELRLVKTMEVPAE